MQSPIESPANPLYPPAANTLRVDSFNNIPPSWRWSIGVTDEDTYTELQAGNDSMTQKEWDSWTTQPYDILLEVAAKHLGLVLA